MRVAHDEARRLLDGYEPAPVADPLGALLHLAGRMLAWVDVAERQVATLDDMVVTTPAGAEQARAAITVWTHAMDDARRILTDISRLDIDARIARIADHQIDRMVDVLDGALTDLGQEPDQDRVSAAVQRRLEALGG